jgi:hypothetical protein
MGVLSDSGSLGLFRGEEALLLLREFVELSRRLSVGLRHLHSTTKNVRDYQSALPQAMRNALKVLRLASKELTSQKDSKHTQGIRLSNAPCCKAGFSGALD